MTVAMLMSQLEHANPNDEVAVLVAEQRLYIGCDAYRMRHAQDGPPLKGDLIRIVKCEYYHSPPRAEAQIQPLPRNERGLVDPKHVVSVLLVTEYRGKEGEKISKHQEEVNRKFAAYKRIPAPKRKD